MEVVGAGPRDAEWAVVGEGPGFDEDRKGKPFVGKTGEEMLRLMDGMHMPYFLDTFRSNLYRHYGGKDYDYTPDDFARDEPKLIAELHRVRPALIVAVGRHAVRYFLGDVSLEEVHGLPWHIPASIGAYEEQQRAKLRFHSPRLRKKGWNPVIFPVYHPAAGFRSPELSSFVTYDFTQLANYARGVISARVLHDDPIPDPVYTHVTKVKTIDRLASKWPARLGFDSEGSEEVPWSVQWAHDPGTGFLLKAEAVRELDRLLCHIVRKGTTLAYHKSLHDRKVMRGLARLCGWDESRILFEIDQIPFDDTMVMAYLLQMEPQGLKGLATRHANMSMMSYDEVLGDAQFEMTRQWLLQLWDIFNFDYEQEQQEVFARINRTPLRDKHGKIKKSKDGTVRLRQTKVLPKLPKPKAFQSVERCLKSLDAVKLWDNQVDDIHVEVYNMGMGEMPQATLEHVDFEGPKGSLRYGCRDADAEVRVLPEMERRIDGMRLRDVYNLELSTYPLLDRMMEVGMRPNPKAFRDLSAKLLIELADLQVRIETVVGREGFNSNSGDQVEEFLFGDLGLTPIKKTDSGSRWSTNDKILEALEQEHGLEYPVITDIRSYREYYKLKNSFSDRVGDLVDLFPHDGRIHFEFRTTRVITGRLAGSMPEGSGKKFNPLAMPEHGKFAKDFKAGWVADPGHVIYNADQSQIELRVLADLSQDPVLREAYLFRCEHEKDWEPGKTVCPRDPCTLRGDLHSRLAHQMFNLKPSQQDKSKHRLPAKAVNFGIPMGMTKYGLAIELRKNGVVGIDEEGAQDWLDATNKLYARVPAYKNRMVDEAFNQGFVRCMSGRIRYIGGIRSKDDRLKAEADRFAFSTPIQEGAQRTMKQCEAYIYSHVLMPRWRQGYYRKGPKPVSFEPLVQVHDALRFEIPADPAVVSAFHTDIVHAMTKAPAQLSVPFGVEAEVGPNLRDMVKIK